MTDGTSDVVRVSIRSAIESDAQTIVGFVKELAKFEKEPAANVRITEETVLQHGFGPDRKFEVLMAEDADAPVGMVLFFETYSTWEARPSLWIEELFVVEKMRGGGIGQRLIAEVAQVAKFRNCGRIELAALKWNPAVRFYERLGFEALHEWQTFRLEGESIGRLTSDRASITP